MSRKQITYRRLYERSRRWKRWSFVIALIIIALLAAVWLVADSRLREYEGSQSIYAAREYFERLKNGELDGLYESEKALLSGAETRQDYEENALDAIRQGASLDETPRREGEDTEKYTVKLAGGGTIEFTLKTDGVTRHGYDVWKVKGVKAALLTLNEYTLVCHADAAAFADGVPLTEADIAETGIPGRYSFLTGEVTEGFTDVRYSVKRALKPPVFAVRDAAGRETELSVRGGSAKAEYLYDEANEARKEECVNAVKYLARYTLGRVTVEQMLSQCVRDSVAWEEIKEYGLWKSAGSGSEPAFEDMEASLFTRLAEDRFICRVKGRCVASMKAAGDTVTELDYLMVFRISGDRLLIEDYYTL
ncbi:MAG: hypothetical protein K5784_01040 [Clostridiales bacterium]|nr:hypothetical protein [Clostridiales bacterium]